MILSISDPDNMQSVAREVLETTPSTTIGVKIGMLLLLVMATMW